MIRKLGKPKRKLTKKSIKRILAKSANFSNKKPKSIIQPCPLKNAFVKGAALGAFRPNTPLPVAQFPENPNKMREGEAYNVFPGKQSYQNCGIESARQIIEQAKRQCLNLSELQMLNEAIEKCGAEKAKKSSWNLFGADPHPEQSGATNSYKIECILKQHGVNSTVQTQSVANLKKALKEGKGIIANVDAGLIWNDPRYIGGGHAVVITDGKFDGEKLLGVYINDTGTGERYYRDIASFINARLDGGNFNITDSPIWSK